MISFILMLKLTTKLVNKFSYYITTHFITSNKDYNFCRNSHSGYQIYPKQIHDGVREAKAKQE